MKACFRIRFAFILSLMFTYNAVEAATKTWIGVAAALGDPSWSNTFNWFGGVPGAGDVAVIGFGDPVVDAVTSCAGVTFTGSAMLTLSGNLVVSGSVICNSGLSISIAGSGFNTLSAASIFINSNTGFTVNASNIISSAALTIDNGASLKNSGTFNLTGNITSGGGISIKNSGAFNVSGCNYTALNGDVITNDSGCTFTVDGVSKWDFSAGGSISNAGTFKAGTTGSTFTLYLANFGSKLTNMSTGTFNLASTSEISFENPSTAAINTATGTVVNSGTFIIMSDANGSGTIGQTNGNVNVLQGTYQVQRYVQGGSAALYRGYRTMTSPVSTTGTTGGFIDLSYVPASTIVTGALASPACTTCNVGGNPSLYIYDEMLPVNNSSFVSGVFVGITDINTINLKTINGVPPIAGTAKLPVGNGFYFYFRGDKTTNVFNKTNAPYANAEPVVFTATGKLNQGNIAIQDWYGSTTTLSKSNPSAISKGFHLVGNPYACSIDWDTFTAGTAIIWANIDPTIHIYNTTTKNYSTYTAGGMGYSTNMPVTGNHNANIIPSGQGFFVQAIGTMNSTLTFTEAAKIYAQQATTSNLLLSSAPVGLTSSPQFMRIQLFKDSADNEDALLFFNNTASPAFVQNEDGPYLKGASPITFSTMSSDNTPLAINKMSLLKKSQTIGLNVSTGAAGSYQLNRTEMGNIPNLFDVWLMDAYQKDSLDIKHNPTYAFNVTTDTATSSAKRFSLVIRQNPAFAYHLLSFSGDKVSGGVQTNWTTENEADYTAFSVERSTNNGGSFIPLGSVQANGTGSYSYLDPNPAVLNFYRLKQTDINGTVTYSNVVQIGYGNLANSALAGNNISVYPNPVKDVLNLNILIANNVNANATYSIDITNSSGSKIKTYTSQQTTWQNNISDLMPGVYVVKVVSNTDHTTIGTSKFVKL
jgi:hypothetical protein